MDDFVTFRGDFERQKGASDKRYKDNSKKRLLANLKKKFDTTIIGALLLLKKGLGSYGVMDFVMKTWTKSKESGKSYGWKLGRAFWTMVILI